MIDTQQTSVVDSWKTSLPKSLQDPVNFDRTKRAVTQWARLVSWTWTSVTGYSEKTEPEQAKQEQALKKFVIEMLQIQCQNKYAYESYGDELSKQQATTYSAYFKSILKGKNNEVPFIQDVKVTLSDVLKKLSGETCVFTEYPDFTEMFTFVVVTAFTGTITEVVDENGKPILKNGKPQYISLMAYPPRPVFCDVTVTEQQVCDWACNLNTGGNYLPPSVYIPIAGT